MAQLAIAGGPSPSSSLGTALVATVIPQMALMQPCSEAAGRILAELAREIQ